MDQDVFAEIMLPHPLKRTSRQDTLLLLVLRNRIHDLFADFRNVVVALLLRMLFRIQRVAQSRAVALFEFRGKLVIKRQRRHFHFLRLDLRVKLANGGDDALDGFVPKRQRVRNFVLGDFERARLYHHDRFLAARDNNVERTRFLLGYRGIDHEIAIQHADADRRNRGRKRQVGTVRGCGCRRDRQHIGIVFIHRENEADDLRFVAPGVREKRPHRPINQPRDQNLAFGGAPFALEKTAGNLTGRIGVFAVVHREGQKISVVRAAGHTSCAKDD